MLRIERCLVDAGYVPAVVYDACRRVGGAMMPAKGVGIGASHRPMAEYRRKKGEVCGHHWHIPNVRPARELRHVRVDTNYWKTFCHDRLATAHGDGWHLQAQAHRAKLVGANSTPALPTRCAAA